MRTVEQVLKDFKAAEKAEADAHKSTEKYRSELQEIYKSAKDALGIVDIFPH